MKRQKRFENLPGAPRTNARLSQWLGFFYRRLWSKKPKETLHHHIPLNEAEALLASYASRDSITWLGQAAFLLRLNGRTILTDPYLSDYASPFPGWGPKRYLPPGLSIEALPAIDILILSHNHYDHLDMRTLRNLPNKDVITVIVPAKLAGYFKRCGYRHVYELYWYDSLTIHNIKITALPCVHYSRRGLFDKNKTLWAAFAIERADKRYFFAGDTAYNAQLFQQMGKKYGPFDYALLGIATYAPHVLLQCCHINPEEAVQLGQDLGAKKLVAMHWGTVILSDEPVYEPPERFIAAGKKAGFHEQDLWVMKIGETRCLKSHPIKKMG